MQAHDSPRCPTEESACALSPYSFATPSTYLIENPQRMSTSTQIQLLKEVRELKLSGHLLMPATSVPDLLDFRPIDISLSCLTNAFPPHFRPTAKKRTSEAISTAPSNASAQDEVEELIKKNTQAVKKAKTDEQTTQEPHKTKEMPIEEDGDAMDMDMSDDDDEQYVTKDDLSGMTPEELAQAEEDRKLMESMGFPTGFGTTKGRHVEGNNLYVANKVKQRKARQLIHKKGRPKTTGRPHPK